MSPKIISDHLARDAVVYAHRYQCRGDDGHVGAGLCPDFWIGGIGGVRVDRAISKTILEAVPDRAVDAAIHAADRTTKAH